MRAPLAPCFTLTLPQLHYAHVALKKLARASMRVHPALCPNPSPDLSPTWH